MFKRLVDAVPEVKIELYSFKTTIKCREMVEQDCLFENKVRSKLRLLVVSCDLLVAFWRVIMECICCTFYLHKLNWSIYHQMNLFHVIDLHLDL